MCKYTTMLALEIYSNTLVFVAGSGTALRVRWMQWSEVGLGAEDMPWIGCGGVGC